MRMTIFATPRDDGQWTLTDKNGNEAQEGFAYPTKAAALSAAKQLWPANSVWKGKSVRNGWQIEADE